MPHVNVRLYAGRSEEDKRRLAEAIGRALMETLGSSERSISVAVEDVAPDDWMAEVYEPEITGKADVFSQGYRPGTLASRGLSPEELTALRPGLVYVSLSAFGHCVKRVPCGSGESRSYLPVNMPPANGK